MTSVGVYSYTHSVTYLADNILKSFKDVIRLSGLDPTKLVEDWAVLMRGMTTWLASGHLECVVLEVFNPVTDALVGRWDIDIVYGAAGDGSFWTDTEQIKYHIRKAGLWPSQASYRLILQNKPGRPAVDGWRSRAGQLARAMLSGRGAACCRRRDRPAGPPAVDKLEAETASGAGGELALAGRTLHANGSGVGRHRDRANARSRRQAAHIRNCAPALRAVGAAYTADNPKTSVYVPPSVHSSGGIAAVRAGTTPLGRIARPLTLEERAEGIVEVPVFRLPSVFMINPAANVRQLTADQATRIFRGEITNWQEVGGTNLRIKVVRRDEADSTLKVLRATMPGWRGLEVTDKSKLAATTQEAFDLVTALPGAVSFAPYSRSLEANVLVPELDGRHVTDAEYPSAVTLSLIYREATVTEAALDFVRFLFSPKARALIRNFGGIPMRVQS